MERHAELVYAESLFEKVRCWLYFCFSVSGEVLGSVFKLWFCLCGVCVSVIEVWARIFGGIRAAFSRSKEGGGCGVLAERMNQNPHSRSGTQNS